MTNGIRKIFAANAVAAAEKPPTEKTTLALCFFKSLKISSVSLDFPFSAPGLQSAQVGIIN